MHEMSIASALIEQIEGIARSNHLTKIDEVEIETGVLRGVISDVMQTAFRMVGEGTLLESAVLKIVDIKAVAQCRVCQRRFEPQLDNFLCPACLQADVDILQGDDIILKSISGSS